MSRGWVYTGKRQPDKSGQYIACWSADGVRRWVSCGHFDNGTWHHFNSRNVKPPTHWQPLPKPPKKGRKKP